jgi:hypothetical protein
METGKRWTRKTDATDPNDNCSLVANQTETPDATWTADCVVRLVTETITNGTDPLNADTDGDGVNDDGQEATDGTDPLNSDTDGDR